jgi:hypothetical protein
MARAVPGARVGCAPRRRTWKFMYESTDTSVPAGVTRPRRVAGCSDADVGHYNKPHAIEQLPGTTILLGAPLYSMPHLSFTTTGWPTRPVKKGLGLMIYRRIARCAAQPVRRFGGRVVAAERRTRGSAAGHDSGSTPASPRLSRTPAMTCDEKLSTQISPIIHLHRFLPRQFARRLAVSGHWAAEVADEGGRLGVPTHG